MPDSQSQTSTFNSAGTFKAVFTNAALYPLAIGGIAIIASIIGTWFVRMGKSQNIMGDPDRKHVSTSYVERQNLSMRMGMRRFTRLTNAFSKKVENHAYSVALYYMHYNFARIHKTLRVTPAMEAGVSGHAWSIEEIAALLG